MGANIIMGGGLAGLSAAYQLCQLKAGPIVVIEKEEGLGGLARTCVHDGFRFDLGTHILLWSPDSPVGRFLQKLVGPDLIHVPINAPYYIHGVFLDMHDIKKTFRPLSFRERAYVRRHYMLQRLRQRLYETELISERDVWIGQFGKGAYELMVQPYLKKLWGDEGGAEITARHVLSAHEREGFGNPLVDVFDPAQRVSQNSLSANYSRQGIGQIAARLVEGCDHSLAEFLTSTLVECIEWENDRITAVIRVRGNSGERLVGDQFISSLPITELIKRLSPKPPQHILQLADELRFRAMVFVTLFLNQARVDPHAWVYVIEPSLPYIRYADMANWGEAMNHTGKTSMTFEYCCDVGDSTWGASDSELVAKTLQAHQAKFAHFTQTDLLGYKVHRVAQAYAAHTLDYKEKLKQIREFLRGFTNLHLVGAGGTFTVGTMEHSVSSGLQVAKKLCGVDLGVESVPSSREGYEQHI